MTCELVNSEQRMSVQGQTRRRAGKCFWFDSRCVFVMYWWMSCILFWNVVICHCDIWRFPFRQGCTRLCDEFCSAFRRMHFPSCHLPSWHIWHGRGLAYVLGGTVCCWMVPSWHFCCCLDSKIISLLLWMLSDSGNLRSWHVVLGFDFVPVGCLFTSGDSIDTFFALRLLLVGFFFVGAEVGVNIAIRPKIFVAHSLHRCY